MFGRILRWYIIYIYIFGGSGPLTEFCPVQNSLYVQVLRSPILAALLHGTPAAGVSQTLRRGTTDFYYGKSVRMVQGTFAQGATCIRLGGRHVGHRPTF